MKSNQVDKKSVFLGTGVTGCCLWTCLQDEIVTGYKNRLEAENRRYKAVRRQMRQQKSQALRQWYSVRSFLVSEHGVWTDGFVCGLCIYIR